MKRSSSILAIASCILWVYPTGASAIVHEFQGTFAYTFTNLWSLNEEANNWIETSQVDSIHVGDTILGYYRYESETADGFFGAHSGASSAQRKSFYASGFEDYSRFPTLEFVYPNGGAFVVQGGRVVDAFANYESGPYVVQAGVSSFHFQDTGPVGFEARGSITWSAPRRVPDRLQTFAAFTIALAVLFVLQRKHLVLGSFMPRRIRLRSF